MHLSGIPNDAAFSERFRYKFEYHAFSSRVSGLLYKKSNALVPATLPLRVVRFCARGLFSFRKYAGPAVLSTCSRSARG